MRNRPAFFWFQSINIEKEHWLKYEKSSGIFLIGKAYTYIRDLFAVEGDR